MDDVEGGSRIVANLRAAIGELTAKAPESFARSETLGKQWEFAAAVPHLRLAFSLLRRLRDANLEEIPRHKLQDVKKVTRPLSDILERIGRFSSKPTEEVPDFAREHDKILAECDRVGQTAFSVISPLLAYLASSSNGGQTEAAKRKTLTSIEAMRADVQQHVSIVKKESEQILQSLRDTSADVAVSAQAAHFQKEAAAHRRNRRGWLLATILSGALALFFAVGSLAGCWAPGQGTTTSAPASEDSLATIVRTSIPNLLVFGILSFATVWCSRNYRSESHNVVVNRHRVNSLRVFPSLISATEDERTKNAVLVGATQCIFAHQSSGFTPADKDSSGTKAMDFISNLLPGPK